MVCSRRVLRAPVNILLRLGLVSILAASISVCFCSQASAQEYVFRPYRQTQGLENLSINSLAFDRQGFLWVATENGVYRFLGAGFQRFGSGLGGIPEQYINQVFSAPDGTLWVAGDQNLYHWTGKGFQAATSRPIFLMNNTSMTWEGPGRLLLLSDAELYRLRYGSDGKALAYEKFFSPRMIAAHPSLAQLGSITALPDGTVWMACGRMLCSWHNGVLSEWASRQGVPAEFYRSLLQDRQGALWAVGQKHIVELPRTSDRVHPAFIDRSLPFVAGNGVYGRLPIACDPRGRVIVSLAGGVARWNGSAWQTIGKQNGLISNHLTAFLFDEDGDLWMGSAGYGLYHWVGYTDWMGWTDLQGLPSANIWSIGPFDKDRILVGTETGPAILDSRVGTVTLPSSQSWTYGQVTGMIAAPGDSAGGRVFISTASGALVRMEGHHPARTSLVADLRSFIYGLLRDASGRTFALAGHRVFDVSALLQTPSVRRQHKLLAAPPRPAPLPQIDALLGSRTWVLGGCRSADGTIWFASENGLVRLTQEAHQEHWSRPTLQGLPTPLPRLSSMACAKDGTLWVVVGDSGIWRLIYDPGERSISGKISNAGRLHATQLVLPKVVQSISAVQLFVDPRGWLWICTDDGLLVWNGSSFRHLTQEDGLIWNDVNAGNMASGPDGSIWVGTSGGLSRILHPQHLFATQLLRISIMEARLGGRLLPLAGSFDIPWSRHDLSFQYAAPNALNRASLVFFYRLAGLQSDWIESHDDTAHFQTLPPGSYAFEVFAQDSVSGAHSDKIAFRFRIRPPWWRSQWFYALCGLLGVLGVVLIFRLRTLHLLAQQRRLEAMVLERTSQLEASREQLRRQATHDGLTGLLNRTAILEALDHEMSYASRHATSLTLVLADIDHFKAVNDTHGHLAGDEALRQFSSVLISSIRPYDYVGRFGGEEFLLILINVDSPDCNERLTALHGCITGLPVIYAGTGFVITCSLGAVQLQYPQGTIDQKSALSAADEALYEAKRSGRNQVVFCRLAAENQTGTQDDRLSV